MLAISTQSGNGKNASEAITAQFKSNPKDFAFSIACLKASTRDVYPTPLDSNCFPFASTIVFDFDCLTKRLANNKSLIISGSGAILVLSLIHISEPTRL